MPSIRISRNRSAIVRQPTSDHYERRAESNERGGSSQERRVSRARIT